MSESPYTEDDLRYEAGRQFNVLVTDPDYMGVGEQMQGQEIDEGGPTWDSLPEDEFTEAQDKVDVLIRGAAEIGHWAVNLGADKLIASPYSADVQAGDGEVVIARIHVAFIPSMPEAARVEFMLALGKVVSEIAP